MRKHARNFVHIWKSKFSTSHLILLARNDQGVREVTMDRIFKLLGVSNLGDLPKVFVGTLGTSVNLPLNLL